MKQTFKGKVYSKLNDGLVFIESHWRLILYIILVIALIIGINKCRDHFRFSSDIKKVDKFENADYSSELKLWKDKYGNEHARVQNLVIENEAMKYAADSVAKLLKIKPKAVSSISKTAFATDFEIPIIVDTVYVDTLKCPENGYVAIVKNQKISYKDNWTEISGNISDTGSHISYKSRDTLSRVDYSKKKWFLGKRHFYTDFSNSNPNVTVTGYKGLELKETKKRWSIGANIQLGYSLDNLNFKKPVVQAGIGLHYSIIKF